MAMTRARRAEKEAQIAHNINTLTNFSLMLDLAMTRRRWINAPETFDLWFLNRTLTVDGECLFFVDPDIGPLCLPVSSYGRLDVYGRPTGFYVWGMNGYHRLVPASEGVRVFNNQSRTPTLPLLIKSGELLTKLDELCLQNIEVAKTPYIIHCTEEQRKTFERLVRDVNSTSKYIWADDSLQINDLQVLQTGVELHTEQIEQAKTKILNMALMQLGYEQTNSEKKERLVAAEVSINFGITEAIRRSFLDPCQCAIEEAQTKLKPYGWNFPDFKCEFNSDLPTMLNTAGDIKGETEVAPIETV